MPAPKRANTSPATQAATAKRIRAGQETQAARLRAAGWIAVPPEHADQLPADIRDRWGATTEDGP